MASAFQVIGGIILVLLFAYYFRKQLWIVGVAILLLWGARALADAYWASKDKGW